MAFPTRFSHLARGLVILLAWMTSACTPLHLPDFTVPSPTNATPILMRLPDSPTPTASRRSPLQDSTPIPGSPLVPFTPSPETATPQPTVRETLRPSSTPRQQFSDLFFLSDQRLGLWDPQTRETSFLAEEVVEFSLAAEGRAAALIRETGRVEGGENRFELALVDLQSLQVRPFLRNALRVFGLKLSPNGRQVVYTTQEQGGVIHVVDTRSEADPVRVGTCQRELEWECEGEVQWSADSQWLAWSDWQGLWISASQEPDPQMVVSNMLEVTDPRGKVTEIPVTYHDLRWSPNGRYILARVTPSASEVSWRAVIDTRRGQVREVPGTYQFEDHPASMAWMPDGRLFVAYPVSESEDNPFVRIWRVVPTTRNLLEEAVSLNLEVNDIPDLQSGSDFSTTYIPEWPAPISNRLLGIGLWATDTRIPPVLLTVDLRFGKLQKYLELPDDAQNVYWSPGGGGVIIESESQGVLFGPAYSDTLQDMGPIFGEQACCFQWLPLPAASSPT